MIRHEKFEAVVDFFGYWLSKFRLLERPPEYDCTDVCIMVTDTMCVRCPKVEECQCDGTNSNQHEQMVKCIESKWGKSLVQIKWEMINERS